MNEAMIATLFIFVSAILLCLAAVGLTWLCKKLFDD